MRKTRRIVTMLTFGELAVAMTGTPAGVAAFKPARNAFECSVRRRVADGLRSVND